MTELSPLEIRLQANIAQFEAQMQRAKQTMDRQARAMDQRAGQLDRNLTKTGGRFGQDMAPALQRATVALQSFVLRAAAAGIAIGTINNALRGTIDAADRFRQIEGRLTALTGSAERAAAGFDAVKAIAQELGVGIDDVANAFARFTLSAESIGATDEEVARFTASLLKLGRIGGSTQSELTNAMTQISQAMAGGVVRAEEFNSVVENMPAAVKAVADEMGLTMGELRQRMLDGELSARDFFQAVLDGADKTDKQFKELPDTVAAASQRMWNALDMVASALDNAVGISQTWAGVLNTVASRLEAISKWDGQMNGALINYLRDNGIMNVPTVAPVPGPMAGTNRPGTDAIAEYLNRNPITIGQRLAPARVAPGAFDAPSAPVTFAPTSAPMFPVTGQDTTPAARRPGGGRTTSPADEVEKAIQLIEQQSRAIERQTAVVGLSARARAEYLARAELYDAAMRSGAELTDRNRAAIEETVATIGQATEALEAKQAAEEAARRATEDAIEAEERKSQAIADGIDRMTNAIRSARSLEDALRNVAIAAIEVAAQGLFGGTGPAGNIMNKLLGVASGGLFGMLAGPSAATTATSLVPGIGSIPMRAAGGPVSPGNRYLIGERGPEVFVPSMPGYIRPSGGGTGGGGNMAPVINIDARGAQQGVAQQIERVMAAQARNITRMMRQAQAEGR